MNGQIQKHGTTQFPRCIASNCMQWEWRSYGSAAYVSPFNGTVIAQAQPGTGDCGLKRKP